MSDTHPALHPRTDPPVFPEPLAAFVTCCAFGALIGGGLLTALALF